MIFFDTTVFNTDGSKLTVALLTTAHGITFRNECLADRCRLRPEHRETLLDELEGRYTSLSRKSRNEFRLKKIFTNFGGLALKEDLTLQEGTLFLDYRGHRVCKITGIRSE